MAMLEVETGADMEAGVRAHDAAKPETERAELGALMKALRENDLHYSYQSRLADLLDAPLLSAAAKSETERAFNYARYLAEAMWARYFKERAPDWKAYDDLLGVLTQIDNMVAGMRVADSKDAGEPVARERIQRALDVVQAFWGTPKEKQQTVVLGEVAETLRAMLRPQAADAQPLKAYADAVAWVERRLGDFLAEHSTFDPETGATEFGRGPRGRAMEEYAGELQEIIDGLRAHGITGKDNAS